MPDLCRAFADPLPRGPRAASIAPLSGRIDLGPEHLRTFAAVADTFLLPLPGPGRLWRSSASDLGLPRRLPALFARLPDDRARADLLRALRLLDTRGGGLVLHGRPRAFTALSAEGRARALRAMATSPLPAARQAFQALKRLTGFLLATTAEGEVHTEVWDDLGYPGPLGPPPTVPPRIEPVPVREPGAWTADAVVVGSGAGGGPAAAVLAQAGLDVVVVERGPHVPESALTHLEAEAYPRMYLDGNLSTTRDLGILLLAGACLGGGTVVNYTTSFPLPDRVREEWDQEAGFREVFTGEDYEASTRAVLERLDVNTEHGRPSERDALMESGLRALGWHVDQMPRNVRGCGQDDECGYCTMGCRRGAKRSALVTWLEDAYRAGARIVVGADVTRVLVERGRAVGVEGSVDGVPLTVRARAVVLACGGLSTPALLLRSGVGGPAAGRYLRLHPATAMWGRFPDRAVRPWTGTIQARFSDELADLDGRGYGARFETTAAHPGLVTAFFGWDGAEAFKRSLLDFPHWSFVGVLLRDRGSGRVVVRGDGSPEWRYRLSRLDAAHMARALRGAAEVLAAAGAEEVLASTAVPVTWRPGDGSLDGFMDRVRRVGFGSNQTMYASFHQMGSARMGTDPATSVVGEENEAHEVRGLFIMDASCFPTASGVNPMISVSALAHRAARALAARLA